MLAQDKGVEVLQLPLCLLLQSQLPATGLARPQARVPVP